MRDDENDYVDSTAVRMSLHGHKEYVAYLQQLQDVLASESAEHGKQCPAAQNTNTCRGNASSRNNNSSDNQQGNHISAKAATKSRRASSSNSHDDDDEDDDDEKKNDNNMHVPFPLILSSQCRGCHERDILYKERCEKYNADLQRCWSLIWTQSGIIENMKSELQDSSSSIAKQLQIQPVSPPTLEMTTKPKRKKKRKKQKKRKAQKQEESQWQDSYDPQLPFRVRISHRLTEEIVPNAIREKISNPYQQMRKALAFAFSAQDDLKQDLDDDKDVKVINYKFHSNDKFRQSLYCVMKRCDERENGFQWNMTEQLYTENELSLSMKRCTASPRASIKEPDMISMVIQQEMHRVLAATKWSKIAVFAKKKNKQRTTHAIITDVFKQKCSALYMKQEEEKENGAPFLIPIVMFNEATTEYRIEYVQIVRIAPTIDIGVALVYDQQTDCVFVAGIHLDKQCILQQHELLLPHDSAECHCLDAFTSNIDRLRIGNLDEDENKIKHYQRENEILRHANMNESTERNESPSRSESFNFESGAISHSDSATS